MKLVWESINKLQEHIQQESYKGYDPYDTLLSPLFKRPFFNSRIVRFGAQQVCKRIPISLRKPLMIKKGLNPVTIGLSIQAYSYLATLNKEKESEYLNEIGKLKKMLYKVKSKGYSGICWGYDFDWEARYTKINAYVPTSVVTGIITNSLFEYYLLYNDEEVLNWCIDASKFILNDLNKSYEGELFCYSYSPVDKQYVFNASLKAARLLSQVYSITKDEMLKVEASKAVEYVFKYQRENGSWAYANHDARTWADNYHTGYNLDCIDAYMKNTGDFKYQESFNRGLDFYINNFFLENGMPKFYDNKVFPIDSTAAAQSLLSLSRFGHLEMAYKVAHWYINNMQAKNGGFYFRKHKNYTDKNIFMRWSNAWIFAGLSYYLKQLNELNK